MNGLMMGERCRSSFARHETFHPRFGWLKKAYDEANRPGGGTFASADAPVRLGVGKNMVNAIRYWGLAFKVLQEAPNPERPRVPLIVPSSFGRALLDDEGWDPYLERPESLWLLHWQLLRRTSQAPTWWVAFNAMSQVAFTESELQARVSDLASAAEWSAVVPASIKKDVDCLVRTYTVRGQGRQTLDDVLDCPFRELGLLERAGHEDSKWRVAYGAKPTLSSHVVLFASLDYVTQHAPESRAIGVARLATDPGGPGRSFGLREVDLYAALSEATRGRNDLVLTEAGGLRQLALATDDVANTAERVAAQIYDGRLNRLSA
ncbi:DUF4007 family protein [Nocardioides zeae]|uniref:DUF4007 domain-containing protein n=1 Tax=Nocardioides zeae TaxID=1457234 RepID=A0AAJ1U073_9ACTN|nr:DUF4007 family protein [Nocardioides zeae]MDQ1102868.1 hypothetical protein [Nocardioides zeae]